jgi:predicted KAP-like P-loop ATPase
VYSKSLAEVNENGEGKPLFLVDWETDSAKGKEISLTEEWNDDFIKEWLKLSPTLADKDLRGALYVSREHAPIVTPEDRLSSLAAGLLDALIQSPDMASSISEDLSRIQKAELSVIMDRLLERAKQEQEWGVPPILEACITVTRIDEIQAQRLANFLSGIIPSQLQAGIVPKISSEIWAKPVFEKWLEADISLPVKQAIKNKLGIK